MSNFDQIAETYENRHNNNLKLVGESSAYFVAQKVDILSKFWRKLHPSTPGRMLDFGCGIGRTFSHLQTALPEMEYHGVDPSRESVRVAQKEYGESKFSPLENSRIPFADNSFDLVMAACVIHHIPPSDRAAVYQEIRRVLKPGGHFMVFEHNPWNPGTQYLVRTCEFDDDAILISAGKLRRSLSRIGLNTRRKEYISFFPTFIRTKVPNLEQHLTWCPAGAQYWLAAMKS